MLLLLLLVAHRRLVPCLMVRAVFLLHWLLLHVLSVVLIGPVREVSVMILFFHYFSVECVD